MMSIPVKLKAAGISTFQHYLVGRKISHILGRVHHPQRSPRSMTGEELNDDELMALFEVLLLMECRDLITKELNRN